MKKVLFAAALVALSFATLGISSAKDTEGLDAASKKALEQAVAASQRSDANRARDKYRHPVETLGFFGIKPTNTVVEIWPGGGWYTEILAPYLADKGKLIVVSPAGRGSEGMAKWLDANPTLYGKVTRANFPTVLGGTGVPAETADAVLTFRNVHNWGMGYMHPEKKAYSGEAFREMFAMLKPGGVLGIERSPPAGKCERRTREIERLCQGVDGTRTGRGGRVQVRRSLRGQRESKRHDRVAGRRVDASASIEQKATRIGTSTLPLAKATG